MMLPASRSVTPSPIRPGFASAHSRSFRLSGAGKSGTSGLPEAVASEGVSDGSDDGSSVARGEAFAPLLAPFLRVWSSDFACLPIRAEFSPLLDG